MKTRRHRQAGATVLEFVLIGIAMIFMLICLFEISRGLWAYHSLAYAVREGTRYAAMHGADCASNGHSCTVTVGNIVTQMKNSGGGFDPDNTTLTFTPQAGSAISDTMTNLATGTSSSTQFPPSSASAQGNTVQISSKYRFKTVLAMLWFGGPAISDSGTFYLTASSTELIQF
jgi:Flp pilus assembly protein TadG